ncbi:hypothetical protein [Streptomyces globosus]|nr:hypothetical protein [Streptomyces globosus]
MTLRHPYEDRKLTFTRHAHAYRIIDTFLLASLLSQLVEAGEAHRLGDPEWLSRVVGRLTPLSPWLTRNRLTQAVEQAWQV